MTAKMAASVIENESLHRDGSGKIIMAAAAASISRKWRIGAGIIWRKPASVIIINGVSKIIDKRSKKWRAKINKRVNKRHGKAGAAVATLWRAHQRKEI